MTGKLCRKMDCLEQLYISHNSAEETKSSAILYLPYTLIDYLYLHSAIYRHSNTLMKEAATVMQQFLSKVPRRRIHSQTKDQLQGPFGLNNLPTFSQSPG